MMLSNSRPHRRAYMLAATSVALALVVGSLIFVSFSHTVKATKLLVISPTSFMDLSEHVEITVKAIDDAGNIDVMRNDLVELSARSVSRNTSMAKLSATSIELRNGVGSVYVVSDMAEVVDVTAIWKEGASPLKPSTVRLFIGIGEE